MKIFFIFIIAAAVLSSISMPFIASGQITIQNPLNATTVAQLIGNIADFIFTLALWVAPIMFLLGGGYFLISAGDPQKIEMGKKIMTYAVIGLIIAISAKGLINLFKATLGNPDIVNQNQGAASPSDSGVYVPPGGSDNTGHN